MAGNYPRRNIEGYNDPTPHAALQTGVWRDETMKSSEDGEAEERIHQFMRAVKALCELGGLELVERISVKDRKTGRIYR